MSDAPKIPFEVRAPFMLVLHGPNSAREILARKIMMVPDEVNANNVFFCKTGQLKRYWSDKGPG